MKLRIISEDENFLVVEKPPNLVVNRAKTVKGKTLQDWVEKKLETGNWKLETPSDFIRRSGVVHRLDKETSGLLLVAKTEKAFENLQRQFKERQVVKKYLALVHGEVSPKKGRIEVPLSRDRKKFGVFLGGRPALTKYEVKKYYNLQPKTYFERSEKQGSPQRGGSYTLLELTPETGRTHQIRVHLKFIGHPVVADATYAGRKTSRRDRVWCPRQFLHASHLSFVHPETRKRVEFISPLPPDLKAALTHLKISSIM